MEMDCIHIYSVFISVDFDPGLLASSVGNIQAAFAFHPLLFLPVRLFPEQSNFTEPNWLPGRGGRIFIKREDETPATRT